MNPMVLNYLQNQQMEEQPSNVPMPQPMNVPNQQSNNQSNPFDVGIQRAIESARQSLGMTEKQQDKALRRSLMAFGDTMAQQPVQKGFFNNFGAVARSLSPAIGAYDAAEDESLKSNNMMANQILAYRAAEQANQARQEEQAWRREHAENQLAEQQRYHDMMSNRYRGGLGANMGTGAEVMGSEIGGEYLPIQDKREILAYSKDKKALGTVLQDVNELENSYNKFRKDYEGNIIDPMSAISGIANPAKDILGRFGYMKELRQETADRKTLGSKLNKFVVTSERALKGGGVMGPTLIKMFKEQGIYPDLDHDTPEIFESKLKMLKEEIENSYKAANFSLNYGVRVDPSQVHEIENRLKAPTDSEVTSEENMGIPQAGTEELIMMKDNNGQLFQIPANEVEEAVNDGLVPLE